MDRVSQAALGENNFLVIVNSKFKSRGLFEIFKAGTEARVAGTESRGQQPLALRWPKSRGWNEVTQVVSIQREDWAGQKRSVEGKEMGQ